MHTLCVRPTRRPASLSTGRFSLRRFAIRVLLAVPALLMAIVLSWAPAVIAADSVTTPDADGVIALGNHNSLQLDAAGNPVVSYTVGPPTNTLRILHCDDPDCAPGGESKQDPDTSGNAVGALNSLALDANGYPVVSYRDDTSETLRILHCNDANCDATINGPESVTTPDMSGDNVGQYTSLQLDGLGHPVVSYFDRTNGALKILHCNDPNCAGGDESIESPDVGTIAVHPANSTLNGISTSLRLDASGYPVVAYQAFVENDTLVADAFLKLMHCNDANCAGGNESITKPDPRSHTVIPFPTLTGYFPSLQLASGLPVITYISKRLQAGILHGLTLLRCNDVDCAGLDEVPHRVVNVDFGLFPTSLQLGALEHPVIAYGYGLNDLFLSSCNDPSCDPAVNGSEVTVSPAPGFHASKASLQLDGAGHPVVSFIDTSADLHILHCDDPLCLPPPVCGDTVVGAPEECDDGNTDAGDGCDDLCRLEFCGDGTTNNDGAETCDDGNTDAGDGCDEACQLESVDLNHFQCYDVARTKFDRFPVDLVDDFGPSITQVRRPRLLCAPVNKNDEDPTAPDDLDHLIGYQTRRTSARFERQVEEVVTDQFGTLVLDLQRPERLLVPSAKDLSGPASPLDPPVVDHYQCYKVRGDRRRVQDVEVEDQFTENGPDLTDVKKPLRLCLPVDKNGEGILDNAARLMCYLTKPGPRVNREVWFDNQFGGGILEVRRARELCVPVEAP